MSITVARMIRFPASAARPSRDGILEGLNRKSCQRPPRERLLWSRRAGNSSNCPTTSRSDSPSRPCSSRTTNSPTWCRLGTNSACAAGHRRIRADDRVVGIDPRPWSGRRGIPRLIGQCLRAIWPDGLRDPVGHDGRDDPAPGAAHHPPDRRAPVPKTPPRSSPVFPSVYPSDHGVPQPHLYDVLGQVADP